VEEGVEFSGRTVEDAVAQAEAELGERREALEIEVVSQGSRGVFGIRSESARIRVRRSSAQVGSPELGSGIATRAVRREPSAATTEAEVSATAQSGFALASPAATKTAPRRTSQNGDLATEASEVLRQLLHTMGFDVEVSVQNEENPLTLAVSGENLGILIGRRGDNLSALQFMVNLILSKNRRQWPRVVLDVENYRARREESLRSLADRVAYRVRRNGRPFTLEAMPASDRRIIHLALRDRPDVETYSIGEGPARRVVVAPKRPERAPADQNY
jgi:spoIIIJ-associated protein